MPAMQTLGRRFVPLLLAALAAMAALKLATLGLAYVHEMVIRLGGTVTVASQPSAGSHFTVVLPMQLAVPAAGMWPPRAYVPAPSPYDL